MKKIILLSLIGILLASGFYINREQKVKGMRSELSALQSEKLTLQQAAIEIARLEDTYVTTADIPAFADALYGCARQAGILDHEITTIRQSSGQQVQSNRSKKNKRDLKVHSLQVALSGDFHQISDYIDQTQNLAERNKITKIKLIPGETKLQATFAIDLYSLGASHAR